MQIIPALYLKHQRFALFQPGNRALEYLSDDPYALIGSLSVLDVPRIHIIDQDSWGDSPSPNTGLIGSLGKICGQRIEAGGGIRDMDALRRLRHAGVNYFVIGSALFDHFSFLVEISKDPHFPNSHFLISIDINKGKLAHAGHQGISVQQLIQKCIDLGFRRFIVNDLNTFRINDGPDVRFYRSLVEGFPSATFSASGRIITLEHIESLEKAGVAEVMVGNEIYLEAGLLDQVSRFNHAHKALGMA